ncbi:MAG: Ig-like domain-containing protein [Gemmatimonadota bacterium]
MKYRFIGSSVTGLHTRHPLLGTFLLLLLLASCRSDSLGPTLDLDNPVDGDLVVEPVELLLTNGESGWVRPLMRTLTGVDLSSFPGSERIVWSVDRPAIADVAKDGSVSAKLPGETRVTATLDGRTASAFVTVLPRPAALRPLMDLTMLGTVGATLRDSIGVQVIDEGGLPVAGFEVRFSTELGDGRVSPKTVVTDASGIARVSWRLGGDIGLQAVRVASDGLDEIYLSAQVEPTSDRLRLEPVDGDGQEGEVGELLDRPLKVRVVDEFGNPVTGQEVSWELDAGSLVTATSASDSEGLPLLQAKSTAGNTGLTEVSWRLGTESGTHRAVARLPNGFSAWFEAKASAKVIASVEITPGALDLEPGRRASLDAVAYDPFGNKISVDPRWSSANPAVATVSKTGEVVAVSVGTTEILAETKTMTATATVRVLQVGASRILVAGGNSQVGQVSTTLPTSLAARVVDGQGRGVPGIRITWGVASGGGSLSARSSTTDQTGTARSSWTLGGAAGVQRVTAGGGGLTAVTFVAQATAAAARTVRVLPSVLSIQPGDEVPMQAQLLDGQGNPIYGTTFTWSSTNVGVARVGPKGTVDGISPGQSFVYAQAGSVRGLATVNVAQGAGRVQMGAPRTNFSALGDMVQFTAQAYNASGGKISGSFNWVSRDPGVASVDALGRVTSKSNGSTRIVACSGACDSLSVTVRQIPNAVSFGANSFSIGMGSTQSLGAKAVDPRGNAVQGASWTFSSSNTSVVSVSAAGAITGVSTGSATITARATAQGTSVNGQVSVTVSGGSAPPPPPPPPPPVGGAPDLPRSWVNTSYTAPGGRTIRVRQGDDLQAAINNAQRGDILMLDAGATFRGDYVLPAKAGSGWIVITTNTTLPPAGARVTPQSASNFARIEAASSSPALWVKPGASQYRIMGVEVGVASSAPFSFGIVKLGDSGAAQNSLSKVPRDIILDRVYVHGPTSMHVKRCVEINASPAAVIDSWLSDCHAQGQDSQAILGWNAPGPFKIVNNYLEGAGENVMFGGADPSIAGLVPSDIEIRHNHLFKPLSWQNTAWTVKNHFELKMARRVLFEGNVLENNWIQAQTGYSIVFQSLNQGGGAPQAVVEHVTVRYNLIRNSVAGINLLSRFKATSAQAANNILIEHNVLDRMGPTSSFGGQGRTFQVLDDIRSLTIRRNTVFAGQSVLLFDGASPTQNFVFQGNIVSFTQFGIIGSGAGEGTAALAQYAPGGTFSDNVIIAGKNSLYPSGNHFPGNVSQVGFQNVGGGNYQLSASSPYAGRGADIPALNAATAGAR